MKEGKKERRKEVTYIIFIYLIILFFQKIWAPQKMKKERKEKRKKKEDMDERKEETKERKERNKIRRRKERRRKGSKEGSNLYCFYLIIQGPLKNRKRERLFQSQSRKNKKLQSIF